MEEYCTLPLPLVTEVGGHTIVYMHSLEYSSLGGFIWSPELRERSVAWYTRPIRFTTLLSDLSAAGLLEWTRCANVDILAGKMLLWMGQLPPEQRALGLADVHAYDEPDFEDHTFYDRIKPIALMGRSMIDIAVVVVDFKTTFAGAFTEDERDDEEGLFQSICENVLDVAGSNLTDKSVNIQATQIVSFFKRTQPDTAALRLYRPYDEQLDEIGRRSHPHVRHSQGQGPQLGQIRQSLARAGTQVKMGQAAPRLRTRSVRHQTPARVPSVPGQTKDAPALPMRSRPGALPSWARPVRGMCTINSRDHIALPPLRPSDRRRHRRRHRRLRLIRKEHNCPSLRLTWWLQAKSLPGRPQVADWAVASLRQPPPPPVERLGRVPDRRS